MSGNPSVAYPTIACDLPAVFDDGDDFRILPVIGKGSSQNPRNIRFLKAVDLGLTRSNLLDAFRQTKGEI